MHTAQECGSTLGFVTGYAVFTTALFLILGFTGRLPASWTIMHIAAATGAISAVGIAIRRYLGWAH